MVCFPGEAGIFRIFKGSRWALGQASLQCVPKTLLSRLKGPEHEPAAPSVAEVKNERSLQ
jgi:hypothetical protein